MTLAGRIQIFKSLALSKTIYASTMIHPSKRFMGQLYSLQKDFIWRRPPKIKHTTLIADYVDGGYKDVDIATKLESLKSSGLDVCLIITFMRGRQYHTLLNLKILNLLKPVQVKSIFILTSVKSLFHHGRTFA